MEKEKENEQKLTIVVNEDNEKELIRINSINKMSDSLSSNDTPKDKHIHICKICNLKFFIEK